MEYARYVLGRVAALIRFVPAIAIAMLAAPACNSEPEQRSDARQRPDAAPPPPGDARLGVDCWGELCDPDQACCYMIVEPTVRVTVCMPTAEACDGTAFDCDGPEDCETATCCSFGDRHVRCVEPDACDRYLACHADEDCGGAGRCCDTPLGIIRVCLLSCPA